MSTAYNLLQASAEESKNRETYLAFSERAEAEGRPQVARLFRAIAESERIHACGELQLLQGTHQATSEADQTHGRAEPWLVPEVRTTAENLQHAVDTEQAEFQDMYGRFLRQALEEGEQAAAALLENVVKVERVHYTLYTAALASIQEGEDLPEARVFVCCTCGNTVLGQRPEVCPICGGPAARFAEVA